MKRRIEAVYKGRVHGVGFRYTAERLAHQFKVTGFVRNMPDGTVDLVAEGEENTLKVFLNTLKQTMEPYIHEVSESWMAATVEFTGFEIRFF